MNRSFWQGKRVLLTGHTGFKGGWLAIWLSELGADVTGVSLAPTEPDSFYASANVPGVMRSIIADINNYGELQRHVVEAKPEVVFHLAAQALVRPSYDDPVTTFTTNVVGLANLLDVVRQVHSIEAVLIVTSDKCYENHEWVWGYRESDEIGGRDPYSASKGCAEIVTRSMKMSFFQPFAPKGHGARIATVRAGNVIGGGDWSKDRLVADIVRGCLGEKGEVHVRNPHAVRPWQHVLDPLAAYIRIAELLVERAEGVDSAWNIGPEAGDNRSVLEVANAFVARLGRGRVVTEGVAKGAHEATVLTLDCTKARSKLRWQPCLPFSEAVAYTVDWYAAWNEGKEMAEFTGSQIYDFSQKAALLKAQRQLP